MDDQIFKTHYASMKLSGPIEAHGPFIYILRPYINITPMKLYGAQNLGSTSVLLNNIDKYVKRG